MGSRRNHFFAFVALFVITQVAPPREILLGQENKSTPKNAPENLEEQSFRLRVVLGDGRTAEGRATIQAPHSFIVRHIRNGITYDKEITLKDISVIRISRWKGSPAGQNKNGKIYQFDPYEYEVELTDGSVLRQGGDFFEFLKQFTITNKNGEARFYSYWRDLLRNDNTWYTGMAGPEDGLRTLPHKDVVRRLEWVSAKDE